MLNVYTMSVNSSLPVLVWLHGGGLASGEGGMYGPYFLIGRSNNIVEISITTTCSY